MNFVKKILYLLIYLFIKKFSSINEIYFFSEYSSLKIVACNHLQINEKNRTINEVLNNHIFKKSCL